MCAWVHDGPRGWGRTSHGVVCLVIVLGVLGVRVLDLPHHVSREALRRLPPGRRAVGPGRRADQRFENRGRRAGGV